MPQEGFSTLQAGRIWRGLTIRGLVLGLSLAVCCICRAHAKDDDDNAKPASSWPTTYLDLNTQFAAIPAGTLSLGLGPIGVLSASSSRNLIVNAPLTVDVTDRFSAYGGVTALTYQTDGASWSPFVVTSWNVGFSADVIQQDGAIPTVTLQSTFTKSIANSAAILSGATLATVVEAGHAFDEDETRGILAGVQYINVFVDSSLVRVEPDVVVYGGGYYQWDNNWKLTARAGIQHFGGAQIGNLFQFKPFTQPIARFNLDKMDDNDNRLFGVAFEVAWTPKPAFQLTLSTPLYAVRK